ncbi:4-carboxymuconolactone decarboxylase [Hymenopellis radicata]|nr:4-carboxymuconolactone decarboxylase [Hymenopellis radicata]
MHKLPVILCVVLSCIPSLLGLAILEKRDDDLPARVPYIFPEPGTDPIADEIRARREGGKLLDLDGVLLQSREFAAGWNQMFSAIRGANSLPGNIRELLILRTAVLNNATYQWLEHEGPGRAEGLTTEQLLIIRLAPPFAKSDTVENVLGLDLAISMTFADEVAKNVRVSNATFGLMANFLNSTQLVDAAATAGGYNFVSRFTVGLDIDAKMDVAVPIPED